jgi:hypothetical protein
VADLDVVEICAGAGGQALGLERAGFEHALAVEVTDRRACNSFLYWGFASRTCVRTFLSSEAESGLKLSAGLARGPGEVARTWTR